MDQTKRIEELEKENAELKSDMNEVAGFIFKTLKALGVKSFDDIDHVGKTAMKEMPTILFEASVNKAKLNARFAHFNVAKPLLEKYKHLIPKD